MAVPKFSDFFSPVLEHSGDGNIHTLKELYKAMIERFSLTQEDISIMLPSGTKTIVYNNVQWSVTYLVKAGLLKRVSRGVLQITSEGMKVLQDKPKDIDIAFLNKYDSFKEFHTGTVSGNASQTKDVEQEVIETPDYTFEEAFKQINDKLADEILSEVMKLSPTAFERMVIDLLQKMGYGSFANSGRTTPITADEGIDGIIMEDKLGFDLIFIQAKQWDLDSSVGRPEIQKFVGAIAGKGGKGLFVTTAKYAKPAITYAEQQRVVLVDGKKLANLMIEHNFGATVKKVFEIKEIDTDVFNDYDSI